MTIETIDKKKYEPGKDGAMKDDLSFVRDRFEHDDLPIPESLSEDAISKLLAAAGQDASAHSDMTDSPDAAGQDTSVDSDTTVAPAENDIPVTAAPAANDIPVTAAPAANDIPVTAAPSRKAKHRRWRPFIAVAACAVLIIALIPAMQAILPGGSGGVPASPVPMTADENGLYQFRSYGELDQEIHSLLPEEEPGSSQTLFYAAEDLAETEDLVEEYAESESAGESGAASGDSSGSADLAVNGESGSADSSAQSGSAQSFGDPAQSSGKTASGADSAARTDGSSAASNGTSDNSGTGTNNAPGTDTPQHSETYTQVEDIDEADIVKTDGRYIYYLSSVENQIIIAKASNGKAKRVSVVTGGKSGSYINDIYVRGNQLLVIGSDESAQTVRSDESWTDATAVTIYDISDRKNPKELSSYSQTGSLLSSRLIGDSLCLVTNDRLYTYVKNRSLPYICYNEDKPRRLPINGISGFPQVNTPAYTVIAMLDLTSGKVSKDTVRTRAILGGSDEIYCSGENLYVTGTVSGTEEYDPASWSQHTQILKISLAGGKVKYNASAIVNGYVNNQWSMDERNGTFRVATTSDHNGEDVNNLYILDKKMNQIGCVIGFAKDEHIEAVRYIKDKAYVITYQQTDPLFIIDLSDPTDPVIEGHVKISGFSTLLVPADANHLLGLGFSTETTEFGEATDGVKLALFDITDPSNPAVADSKAFPDMSSQVQYDHKALLVGPGASWFAIPYEIQPEWTEEDDVIVDDAEIIEYDADSPDGEVVFNGAQVPGDTENTESTENASGSSKASDDSTADTDSFTAKDNEPAYGIMVFSAKAGHLKVLQNLKTSEPVNRCIYIGDYIYGICGDDSIEGFKLL